MLADLTPKDWLSFAVVGTIISTLGALFGVLLRDFFFLRSFETWKQRRSLEQNSTDDPYYRRYKLTSTVYRFAALLGWLELYRQEIVFLHPGNHRVSQKLEELISNIRSDLAEGGLNEADEWLEWKDGLIFREELRAIGECMLEPRGNGRGVMGYGKFCDLFDSDRKVGIGRSIRIVLNFIVDLEVLKPDFRRYRLARTIIHLVDLIQELDNGVVDARLRSSRDKLASVVGPKPVWPFPVAEL